jgi:hypothetical protein
VPEPIRHLAVNRGHNWDISNGHDALIDTSAAEQMTFTGTPEALRARLVKLEPAGATGVIFGTSGADVESCTPCAPRRHAPEVRPTPGGAEAHSIRRPNGACAVSSDAAIYVMWTFRSTTWI